jgi:hypothetical protein
VIGGRTPPGDGRLPNDVQSEFLRACLVDGAAGREGLRTWLAGFDDPLEGLRRPDCADRQLLPLLHRARRDDGAVPAAVLRLLKAAVVHEELRTEAIGAAAGDALDGLRDAGIEPLVIGGAALAWGIYPAPALRHCHNIDLLVAPGELAPARSALGAFAALDDPAPAACSLRLTHPSGTRISLHSELHRGGRSAPAGLERRGISIAGRAVDALGPSDLLVQLCGNAAAAIDPGLRWLADGSFVCSGGLVDWGRAHSHATLARRTAPLSALLGWLDRNLGSDLAGAPRAALARARRGELARELVVRSPKGVRNRLRRALRDGRG